MQKRSRSLFVLILSLIITSLLLMRLNLTINTRAAIKIPIRLQTGQIPWSPATDTLKDRLRAINFPALKEEGNALHTHQHLDIFIRGNKITIPAGIGVNEGEGFISPIHTHDTTGIIHVESPTNGTFTLGQFFTVWGVRFNDNCLGGYCNQGDQKLKVYVNGQLMIGDYQNIVLTPHEEIAIEYGNEFEAPTIPSNHPFPPGY